MFKLKSNVSLKLSEAVIGQLQRQNISTVLEFIRTDAGKLQSLTGLSHKEITEVKQSLSDAYGGKIENGLDLFRKEQNNILVTDVKSLDVLLEGGLHPGQIYELCGLSASGKTQLCLTIACNVALKRNNVVRYIDTKKDFCGSRMEEILIHKNCSKQIIDEVMERVKVCSIQHIRELLQILHRLRTTLQEEPQEMCTRVIIIDSLPALIFKFFKDQETMYTLNQLTNICHYLANEFKLAIVIVNVITQWNHPETKDAAGRIIKEHTIVTPALGKYWSRIPNTRLFMQKDEQGNMKIVVWKSFGLEANTACLVNLSVSGVN